MNIIVRVVYVNERKDEKSTDKKALRSPRVSLLFVCLFLNFISF